MWIDYSVFSLEVEDPETAGTEVAGSEVAGSETAGSETAGSDVVDPSAFGSDAGAALLAVGFFAGPRFSVLASAVAMTSLDSSGSFLSAINLSNHVLQSSNPCLLYTSPSPRDRTRARMPSSA